MDISKQDVEEKISQLIADLGQMVDSPHQNQLRNMIQTLVRIVEFNPDFHDINIIQNTLRELLHSYRVFLPYRDTRKVCLFGSARTKPSHPAYQIAEEFARFMTQKGYMLITGAGGGIMEAGNKGAEVNMSFGANILLPFEQRPNPYIDGDSKLVSFKYFFNRKLTFIKESDATVLCPGGFGTHDEAFEVLTLVQTGRCAPRPIVLLSAPGDSYWYTWVEFVKKELLDQHYISDDDLYLFRNLHSAEEAANHIFHFYRRYHSIRYHGDMTVIRINQPLTSRALEDMNLKFKHLLVRGDIEQAMPDDLPFDNQVYPHIPRLTLYYNRSTFGKLYEIIDYLNHAPD
ncbi:LOG family protein [bacterium]|nr:LOG family protein [bacterium]